MRDAFSSYHPAVNALWFALVLAVTVTSFHPLLLLTALVCALFWGFRLGTRWGVGVLLILFLTGLGKIPMMRQAFALHSRRKWLFLIDMLVPLVLGVILLFNPFGLVTAMISFFGICLILVGILDLSGVLCGGDLFQ